MLWMDPPKHITNDVGSLSRAAVNCRTVSAACACWVGRDAQVSWGLQEAIQVQQGLESHKYVWAE